MTDIDTTASATLHFPPSAGDRVDAWVRRRSESGWFDTAYRRALRDQWRDVAHRHGAESASARGVLLDLVTEVFETPTIYLAPMRYPDRIRWIVTWDYAPGCISEGDTKGEALVVALEAAR